MTLITAKGLCKDYGSTRALNNIDLILSGDGNIALVGPNGAGKTTLFSILCGYLTPSSGSIEILGHKPGSAALHGKLSALPQDAQLDPGFAIGTQLKHLCALQGFRGKAALEETKRVLALVNLSDSIKRRPNELSHGMHKRLTIAQALIGAPELILLDEPTAGLDPVNAREIRQLISDLSEQCQFVISSHNLEELEKLCSQVLYIEQGRLTQQLTSDDREHNGFLGLTLTSPLEEGHGLDQLYGVLGLSVKSKLQLQFRYDIKNHPDFDLSLLHALKAKDIGYRQLSLGRSLEERLFD
ncbi:ABC transporter ATP-binding protein [Ferrimonas aestuarii]|uniref:ABC transporter ATP-binding protein n=1 Tax=Ferrimonas aestuarii TaxID=2569539 RepID=A0A4U1BQH9_9GAMM|nr:ABC transporter ATP-binding protein [Ferrimonas aestuarii]TKB56582.1 ABC transporter ATP-binding protein [Ferrimonas aestuarii]